MSDVYTGYWLVSEYVYNPDGSFAGIVRQKRRVEEIETGKLQVYQECYPEQSLKHHPMGEFEGKHIFDLSIEGRARRYHGPAVIGTGLSWESGVMTGQGVWPHFGHNFTSYAILPQTERQLTGGKFFNAAQMIANIIGLAIPEQQGSQWPSFSGPQWPGEVSGPWQGDITRFSATGECIDRQSLMRTYKGFGWQDQAENSPPFTLRLEPWGPRWRVSGSISGIGKQSGWLFELYGQTNPAQSLTLQTVLDNTGGWLIEFRHWYIDNLLHKLEVLKLSC